MASKCRQNYHEESEASINKQINIELNAHYQYLALVSCQNLIVTFVKLNCSKLFFSCRALTTTVMT
jgi:ferritin